MLLHEQLKEELSGKIDELSRMQKPLTRETALLFIELQGLIEHASTAFVLVSQVQLRLKKVPYRTLGFLPLVLDIRRQIEQVIMSKTYQTLPLLAEENRFIHDENRELRRAIDILKSSPNNKELEQRLLNLETAYADRTQENKVLLQENKELCKVVRSLESENINLSNELKEVTEKYKMLQKSHRQLENEHENLKNNTSLVMQNEKQQVNRFAYFAKN